MDRESAKKLLSKKYSLRLYNTEKMEVEDSKILYDKNCDLSKYKAKLCFSNDVAICTTDVEWVKKFEKMEKPPLILQSVHVGYIIIFRDYIIDPKVEKGVKKYLTNETFVTKEDISLNKDEWHTHTLPDYDDIPFVSEEMARAIRMAKDFPISSKPIISTAYKREKINWLWKNHIPIGELTVIAGKPGQGKTWVALDIAARLSTGSSFPDGSPAELGKTIYYVGGSEDSRDSIYMRLEGLRADIKNICVIDTLENAVKDGERTINIPVPPTIEGIVNTLPGAVIRVNEEKEKKEESIYVKMVVLDSITSLINPNVDIYKSNEVAMLMNDLRMMAKELQIAVVLIMHHKKGKEDHADYKIAGSYGFVSCARVVWHVDRWKDDPHERILTQGKNNLCAQQPSYRFCIEPVFEGDLVDAMTAKVNWLGKEDYDANSYEEEKDEGKVTMSKKAEMWLMKQLENNPQGLERQEILNRAAGIFNERLLERTIKKIGMVERNGKVSFWKLKDVGGGNNNVGNVDNNSNVSNTERVDVVNENGKMEKEGEKELLPTRLPT